MEGINFKVFSTILNWTQVIMALHSLLCEMYIQFQ